MNNQMPLIIVTCDNSFNLVFESLLNAFHFIVY